MISIVPTLGLGVSDFMQMGCSSSVQNDFSHYTSLVLPIGFLLTSAVKLLYQFCSHFFCWKTDFLQKIIYVANVQVTMDVHLLKSFQVLVFAHSSERQPAHNTHGKCKFRKKELSGSSQKNLQIL
jgi:hypothetical protein